MYLLVRVLHSSFIIFPMTFIKIHFPPAKQALSDILQLEGHFRFFSGSEPRKMHLMIPACLHGYAVRSVLHRLMNADAGNVRFWHKADLKVYTS